MLENKFNNFNLFHLKIQTFIFIGFQLKFTLNNDITLKQFIDENINLITATGVFGALTAFFSSSDIYKDNIFFLFFVSLIFFILCRELCGIRPDWNKSSVNLKIFSASLLVIVINIYYNLVTQIPEIVYTNLKILLISISLAGFGYILIKLMLIKTIDDFITNIFAKHRILTLILIPIILFILFIGLFLGVLFAISIEEYVRYLLDLLKTPI